MKKVIIFLIVLIFVASFTVGCKNSEVEELKEQVAELAEKLAEEERPYEGEVRLTNNPADDFSPSWSPDDKNIAFASDRDGNWEIYIMNTDGSGQIRLTNNTAVDGAPSWSPDDKNIAFESDRDGNWEIYIMNADGSGQTNLTDNPADDFSPSWSPDGKRIAFASDRDGNWEIYIMNADGSGQTNLTDNPVDYYASSWSPDGKRIAFESDRDGNYEIYVMNVEGVKEAVEEPVEEEPEAEPDAESTTEEEPIEEAVEETEPVEEAVEETIEKVLTAPTIRLEIIEGPTFSQLGDNTCYYRVKAHITGDPSPAISFNKDDSMGSLGGNISQVNLHNSGDSFTLEATATNSQGTTSDSITLSYACQKHIPILVKNDTGGTLSLSLSGPTSYNFNIPPGQQNIYVIPGTYNYTARGCGGAVESGTEDLSKSGDEWDWWCK